VVLQQLSPCQRPGHCGDRALLGILNQGMISTRFLLASSCFGQVGSSLWMALYYVCVLCCACVLSLRPPYRDQTLLMARGWQRYICTTDSRCNSFLLTSGRTQEALVHGDWNSTHSVKSGPVVKRVLTSFFCSRCSWHCHLPLILNFCDNSFSLWALMITCIAFMYSGSYI
jgi:hypothetical protein